MSGGLNTGYTGQPEFFTKINPDDIKRTKKGFPIVRGELLLSVALDSDPKKIEAYLVENNYKTTSRRDSIGMWTVDLDSTDDDMLIAVAEKLKSSKLFLGVSINAAIKGMAINTESEYQNIDATTLQNRTWHLEKIRALEASSLILNPVVIDIGIIDNGIKINSELPLAIANLNGEEGLDDIHGTHVAGIISAKKNGVGIMGVASTMVNLHAENPPYDTPSILSSLYSLSNKNVRVINMSFGIHACDGLIDSILGCSTINGNIDLYKKFNTELIENHEDAWIRFLRSTKSLLVQASGNDGNKTLSDGNKITADMAGLFNLMISKTSANTTLRSLAIDKVIVVGAYQLRKH